MKKLEKFATQLEKDVLVRLRAYATETDRSISGIVSEAVASYLDRVRVRPAFRDAANAVLDENAELLRRLAR